MHAHGLKFGKRPQKAQNYEQANNKETGHGNNSRQSFKELSLYIYIYMYISIYLYIYIYI